MPVFLGTSDGLPKVTSEIQGGDQCTLFAIIRKERFPRADGLLPGPMIRPCSIGGAPHTGGNAPQKKAEAELVRLPNNAMNLTVRPVTRLAGVQLARDSHGHPQGARPSRPASYRGR